MVLFLRRRYVCTRSGRVHDGSRDRPKVRLSPPGPPKERGVVVTLTAYYTTSVTIAESRRGFATSKYKTLLKLFAVAPPGARETSHRLRRIPIRSFGSVDVAPEEKEQCVLASVVSISARV